LCFFSSWFRRARTSRCAEHRIIPLHLFIAGVVITLIARSTWLRVVLTLSFGLTLLAQLLPGLVPRVTTLSMVFVYNLLVTITMEGRCSDRVVSLITVLLARCSSNAALLFSLVYAGITIVDHDALKIPLAGGRPHFRRPDPSQLRDADDDRATARRVGIAVRTQPRRSRTYNRPALPPRYCSRPRRAALAQGVALTVNQRVVLRVNALEPRGRRDNGD
jgi:hypothetical protein